MFFNFRKWIKKHVNTRFLVFLSAITLFSAPLLASEKLEFASIRGAYIQKISESVLKAAYARLGIDFETFWLPAKRALEMVNSGNLDGEISRVGAIAKLYPDLIRVKIPVNYLEGMAYTKNHQLSVNSWESLRPYKIGINRGIIFAEKGTKGMDVLSVNSFSSLFQVLDKDRVDVIISPRIIGLNQIIELDLQGITAIEPPIIKLEQYHYLHKRHADLVPRLETVLRQMKKSGEIEAIRSTYIQELRQGIIRPER